MIRIKTTLPKEETTSIERRTRIAREVARHLRDYDLHKKSVPYAPSGQESYWVVDGHNDWFVQVDDEGGQEFILRHRYTGPDKEFALASWILANNQGWEIVTPAAEEAACRIDVSLDVALPPGTDREFLDTMSFEIPIEQIVVFIDGEPVPGARVTGYTTGQYAEEVGA